jgi:UTP--glucose-1-phosphate uridylyltransferase
MATHQRASVTKAVIPVAGLGTRFLPATKATPKEMLPVVDKPAIQYVVEEVSAAGIHDVVMVTGRHKRPLEDHFDHAFELEQILKDKGEEVRLAQVCEPNGLAAMHFVRQLEPKGLGDAVRYGEHHVGDEPFAVLLGDDLIDPRDRLLTTMLNVQQKLGGSVIALLRVDPAQISRYGCAAVRPANGAILRVTDLVEKPQPDQAPSPYALIGRYVLDPAVFAVLRDTPPGRGGEVQLTDALRVLAQTPEREGGGVHGVVFTGRRYDTGDRAEYLRTIVRLACEREDLGPPFRAWLEQFVKG